RKRAAPHGMCPAAGEGRRFRLRPHHSTRWEGREGSGDDAAVKPGQGFGAAFGEGKDATRGGPGRGLWRGLSPRCTGAQVSRRGAIVGLAVRLSIVTNRAGSAQRSVAASSRG